MKRLLILVLAALLLLPLTVAFAQDHREGDPFWNPTEEQFAAWNVIDGVEDGATITFWTMSLSPTFDEYIQKIVENFQMTYPGVTVVWEDQP